MAPFKCIINHKSLMLPLKGECIRLVLNPCIYYVEFIIDAAFKCNSFLKLCGLCVAK